MKRRFLIVILFAVFLQANCLSQVVDFKFAYKHQNDTLFIKWIPTNLISFNILVNESFQMNSRKINRKEDSNDIQINNEKTTVFEIKSLREKINSLDSNDNNLATVFLENGVLDSLTEDFFAQVFLQNLLYKEVAVETGNMYAIPNVGKGDKIVFQLKNKSFDSKPIVIHVDQILTPKFEIYDLTVKRTVKLDWKIDVLSNNYCGYSVYRKRSNEKLFKKLNELPIVPMFSGDEIDPNLKSYFDNEIEEGETYYYQLKAIDFFGEERGESDIKKIYIPKTVNAEIEIDSIFTKKDSRIIQVQVHPIIEAKADQIDKIVIIRSDSMLTGYQEVASIKDFNRGEAIQFELKNYISGDNYYYKALAISEDKDTIESYHRLFFTYDSIPPGIATELSGHIDSLGIVSLNWKAPIDKDVRGYRVFRGNFKGDEMYEITRELKNEVFIHDTVALNTLTNEIYYTIISVDNNLNTSLYSDTIELIKPDTIPPVPCIVTEINKNATSSIINWYNSVSKDLSYNELIRIAKDSIPLKLFTWTDTLTNSFVDTSVINGEEYDYYVYTFDKSKNKVRSQSMHLNYELGYRKGVNSFNATIDRENKVIQLNWNYLHPEDVYYYHIYRSKGTGKYELYKTIDGGNIQIATFTDSFLNIDTIYHYKINCTLKSGIKTKMSEEVEVNY